MFHSALFSKTCFLPLAELWICRNACPSTYKPNSLCYLLATIRIHLTPNNVQDTWSAHQPMHTLKLFTLKLLKMLRHVSIFRSSSGSCLFLAKITLLKTFTAWFSYSNLVMWQHVVLCRSSVARSAQGHTQSGALLVTLDLHNMTCCHITKLL